MENLRGKLDLQLNVGVTHGSLVAERDVTLLKTNGVAEKVFTDKIPEKPYTWMGKLLSVAIRNIGSEQIGVAARGEYVKTDGVTVSPVIRAVALADATTMLLEVHRRVWDNEIPNQETVCKYCGKQSIMDIDLSKAKLSEEDEAKVGTFTSGVVSLLLAEGWDYSSPKVSGTGDLKFPEHDGINFNQFVFRVPVLGDAIKHEEHASDSVTFWRLIAAECLVEVNQVSESGEVLSQLPKGAFSVLGIKLFNELIYNEDLKDIRDFLRGEFPIIPFYYKDDCPSCHRPTPVTVEASDFFAS